MLGEIESLPETQPSRSRIVCALMTNCINDRPGFRDGDTCDLSFYEPHGTGTIGEYARRDVRVFRTEDAWL